MSDTDRLAQQHELVAELLLSIGWKSSNDAQWEGLRDALPKLAALASLAPAAVSPIGTERFRALVTYAVEHLPADDGRLVMKEWQRLLAEESNVVAPAAVEGDATAWMARDANGRKDPNLWFTKPNQRDGWELIPLYTAAQVAALTAQCEGLRKDAERYRWLEGELRNDSSGGGFELRLTKAFMTSDVMVKGIRERHRSIGAAIDSAIAAGNGDTSTEKSHA